MTTPRQVREALQDWIPADRLEFRAGWDRRGRPWAQGVRGVMVHDLVGVDQGAIDWTYAAGQSFPFCNSVTAQYPDGRAKVIVNSVLSCWHSGTGGPWPAAGVAKDTAHLSVWGIEMNVWGKSVAEYSDAMIDLTTRTVCAIREVSEVWPRLRPWSRLIRHASWTDGGPELGLTYWLPTRGRKVDTVRPLADWRRDARRVWAGRAA